MNLYFKDDCYKVKLGWVSPITLQNPDPSTCPSKTGRGHQIGWPAAMNMSNIVCHATKILSLCSI